MPNRLLQKHVRQYASSKGLNSNDEENANVTSYSTRVERVQKLPGSKKWTLTLRKIPAEPESDGRVRVDWWTEQFDGVVVASVAENDSPWVPPIPGLKEWAEAYPHEIYHCRNYRRPDSLAGKVRDAPSDQIFESQSPRQYRKCSSSEGQCLLLELRKTSFPLRLPYR